MNIVEALSLRDKPLKAVVTKSSSSSSTLKKESDGGLKEEEEEEEELLCSSERLFHEPNLNLHIIAIMGCKTKINPTIIKDGLLTTLLKHPRFCSLQVEVGEKGGEMKWVPTKVNIENHVIVPEINPIMDISPDKFVEDYISDLSKTTIDMSKPLWEVHILNVKTAEAEATGVFKVHHSIGDGTSLISLLLACTRQTADPSALPTVPVTKKRPVSSKNSEGVWWMFAAFWSCLAMVWNSLVDIFMFFVTLIFFKDMETPLKGAPGVEFEPKRFIHRTLSLDDIKLVKNAMNMTINDVLLGVTTAGLSRYLNRRYGKDKKNDQGATEKRNNLPKNIRLRSTLLVNMRPSSGIQVLSDMMEEKAEAKWGNWIGYVLNPFTISLRDDPLDYVREAKIAIDRKKNSCEALYTYFICEMVPKLFGYKASATLSHRILSHTTMSCSNLIGPLEEIAFYGHPMVYLAPTFYGHPQAFTINYQSYVNKMIIILAVDDRAVPDPHELCDDLEESLKLIKDAILAKHEHIQ